MAKAREIIRRRKSVKNTMKITHTMELVATAKLKKASDRALASQPYSRKIQDLIGRLAGSTASAHPLLARRDPAKHVTVIVIASNRGLCGSYNVNVIRAARQALDEAKTSSAQTTLLAAGKRAVATFKFLGRPADEALAGIGDDPKYAVVEALADKVIAQFTAGQTDRVRVAYTHFASLGKQVTKVEDILPLSLPEVKDPTAGSGVIYAPSATELLGALLPASVRIHLYRCFLESAASEHVARKIAMKNATDNAEEMVKTLTRFYNRARQTQITQEIAELVGGAEAIK